MEDKINLEFTKEELTAILNSVLSDDRANNARVFVFLENKINGEIKEND